MNYYDYLPKRNKYGNQKVTIDGIRFDSKLEGKRWCQLKILERTKEIKDLKRQVPFILIPSYIKNGEKVQPLKYFADFTYIDCKTNKLVIEDIKSEPTKTAVFKIKKKIFEWRYPDLEIIELTKDDI